jgi:hypothetical protein
MGHYAKIVNGVVTKVIVADADFFNAFVDDSPGEWIKTSYNTRSGVHYQPNTNTPSEDQSRALRKNYAGVGYSYSPVLDAFIPPQPYPSWNLNEDTCSWESPIPYPTDGKEYYWNEEIQNWQEIEE